MHRDEQSAVLRRSQQAGSGLASRSGSDGSGLKHRRGCYRSILGSNAWGLSYLDRAAQARAGLPWGRSGGSSQSVRDTQMHVTQRDPVSFAVA